MRWWLLRLSAKILALLRLSVNLFQLQLTKKLQIKGETFVYNRNGRFPTRHARDGLFV